MVYEKAGLLLLLLVSAFGYALPIEYSDFPCDIASSPSTATMLTIHNSENGTQSLDLASIYNLRPEKDPNVIVMCSANCIIELLRQAHCVETDLVEQAKQVVSRWLVIPTSGALEDIANTRGVIKTTQMIILETTHCYHPPCHNIAMEDTFSLAKLYSVSGISGAREVHEVGALRSNEELIRKETIFPRQKYGFHNKSLTVAVVESPPFVFRREMNDSIIFSGVSIDLLNELAQKLNFSYTIVEPEDGEWGVPVDGKWTGLIGQLVEKKAELVVAPISVSRSREEVIDFTVPYFYVDSGIIVRTPSAGTLLTLISPFQYKVHICIAISLFLTTALLLLMEKVSSNHSPFQPVDKLKHYGDTAFNIFGALMYQGCNSPPMASSRILLSAWLVFTVTLAAAYSGNLIASMTDRRQKIPFSTLAELAQQDTYQWGLLGGTSFVTLFKNSNLSDYQAILQGIEINSDGDPDADSINIDVHLRSVLKGRYAFIGEENDFELMQSKSCDLQFMKEQFFSMQFAVGLPNNSVNTKIFSNEVLHLYESGLPRYWYDRWLSKSKCQMQWRQQPYRVNLLALQSLFYVSGAGVVLAGCVLLAEILYSTRRC